MTANEFEGDVDDKFVDPASFNEIFMHLRVLCSLLLNAIPTVHVSRFQIREINASNKEFLIQLIRCS